MILGGLLKKFKVTLRRNLQKNPAKLQFTKEFLVILNHNDFGSGQTNFEITLIKRS